MNKFEKPIAEIEKFEISDVITTSTCGEYEEEEYVPCDVEI